MLSSHLGSKTAVLEHLTDQEECIGQAADLSPHKTLGSELWKTGRTGKCRDKLDAMPSHHYDTSRL